MSLLQAVKAVHPFIGEDHPYSSIILSSAGLVYGMTPEKGCRVACPEVTVDCAVDGNKLLRILRTIKSEDVKLSMDKGRKLKIEAGTRTFHIKALPESAEEKPPVFSGGNAHQSHPVLLAEVSAIQDMAKVAAESGPLMGVHLTDSYCCVVNHAGLVFLWVSCVGFGESVTVPADIFKGLVPTDMAFMVEGKRLWLASDDSLRWTLTYDREYPAESVMKLLIASRSDSGRKMCELKLQELHQLAASAEAVMPDRVEGFRMVLADDRIALSGGDQTAKWGDASFTGSMAVAPTTSLGPEKHAGVSPADLKIFSRMVAEFTEEPSQQMAVSGPQVPIVIWGSRGDASMEVLIRQVYIPPLEK